MGDKNILKGKKDRAKEQIAGFCGLAVCFSGGVDSTLLLALAKEVLGDRVMAVTAVSPLVPRWEVDETVKMARALKVHHRLVRIENLFVPDFSINGPDRCYVCKKILFARMFSCIKEAGMEHMVHGANFDDTNDYRPGLKAADEIGVAAPLRDAGFCKEEIRALAKDMDLSNWNRPAAACLASRIRYGLEITPQRLEMVESAENVLTALGFSGFRVRHLGDTAKIEVRPSEFTRLLKPERRLKIIGALREMGFVYVTMDLEGYGTGRLNRSIV